MEFDFSSKDNDDTTKDLIINKPSWTPTRKQRRRPPFSDSISFDLNVDDGNKIKEGSKTEKQNNDHFNWLNDDNIMSSVVGETNHKDSKVSLNWLQTKSDIQLTSGKNVENNVASTPVTREKLNLPKEPKKDVIKEPINRKSTYSPVLKSDYPLSITEDSNVKKYSISEDKLVSSIREVIKYETAEMMDIMKNKMKMDRESAENIVESVYTKFAESNEETKRMLDVNTFTMEKSVRILSDVETKCENCLKKLNFLEEKWEKFHKQMKDLEANLDSKSSARTERQMEIMNLLNDLINSVNLQSKQAQSFTVKDIEKTIVDSIVDKEKEQLNKIINLVQNQEHNRTDIDAKLVRVVQDEFRKQEWMQLKRGKSILRQSKTEFNSMLEASHIQMLRDQRNFLAAQEVIIQMPEKITTKQKKRCPVHNLETQETKFNDDRNLLIELALEMRQKSVQLENMCKKTAKIKDDGIAAIVLLARAINSARNNPQKFQEQPNILRNELKYSHRVPSFESSNLAEDFRSVKGNISSRAELELWQKQVSDRDRSSLNFEKIYLSTCKNTISKQKLQI